MTAATAMELQVRVFLRRYTNSFIISKLNLSHAFIAYFYFLRNNLNCLNLKESLAVSFIEHSTPSKKLSGNVITFFTKVDLLCK